MEADPPRGPLAGQTIKRTADTSGCDPLAHAARATTVQNYWTGAQTSAVQLQRDARSRPANSHIRPRAVLAGYCPNPTLAWAQCATKARGRDSDVLHHGVSLTAVNGTGHGGARNAKVE